MSQVSLTREYAEKLDADDPLGGFRDRFALDDPSLVYLNGNSLGALPLATLRRLEEVIREAWDTALVSLSHVAYRSGALADMAAITEIVHQAGALMLWDLCHSVGAVPVELDRCDVDLAVGCTYKYLNAGPGAPAFLYVSARLREVLQQPIWGWFSQRDQFAMGPRYDPAAGMAKFMTGTPSIPGTAAVEEGARLLLEAGLDPMRTKSLRLTSYHIELGDAWLEPLGCALATPRDGSRRGGHVTYRQPRAERLVELLADANIITDYRTPDRLRYGLSPLTTRFTDVWTAVTVTRDIIETERENHG